MRKFKLARFFTLILYFLSALFIDSSFADPHKVPPQDLFDYGKDGRVWKKPDVSLVPTFFIRGTPDVMQINNYSCGVAVFQGVAMRFGYWGYQEDFAKILKTSEEDGTHPNAIEKGFKKLGYDARILENLTIDQIKGFLRSGCSVILDYQAWNDEPDGKDYTHEWEDGHYSILVGFNDEVLFIEDPSLLGTIGYLKNNEFISRWHDYEIENGKRREYVHMAIIVKGRIIHQPQFTHID